VNRLEILKYLETEYLPHALQTWDPDTLIPPSYWPDDQQMLADAYLMDGLYSEYGELAGLAKRWVRDGTPIGDDELILELGDVVWYCTVILFTGMNYAAAGTAMVFLGRALETVKVNGLTIETICDRNIAKLADRNKTHPERLEVTPHQYCFTCRTRKPDADFKAPTMGMCKDCFKDSWEDKKGEK
jgi:hypothetical protein